MIHTQYRVLSSDTFAHKLDRFTHDPLHNHNRQKFYRIRFNL